MPFINTKTTVPVDNTKKEMLTAALNRITRECLGKGENWVMTGFEDNMSLSFPGQHRRYRLCRGKNFWHAVLSGCQPHDSRNLHPF